MIRGLLTLLLIVGASAFAPQFGKRRAAVSLKELPFDLDLTTADENYPKEARDKFLANFEGPGIDKINAMLLDENNKSPKDVVDAITADSEALEALTRMFETVGKYGRLRTQLLKKLQELNKEALEKQLASED
mmetsp:Transcript_34016/g.78404  ORF Transcript_34016/g.78404 Transcript_34016/m.78404 type:complete len:133 (-) Transcript_34016:89-487(-)|eukprot:CAMPEP_0116836660 /NCGR_PEP_ID=MMETSP0418-20121206/8223_1 /TAXON_ID=1158023 /ORGANISM="Astrosyne radiata, Strain 13vi08-1A" /LENGTH=132 /DNA_ID=CAMNT_0004466461 /DNA_START=45 /DNA_END=443 /DNA_ORIENTATION=+